MSRSAQVMSVMLVSMLAYQGVAQAGKAVPLELPLQDGYRYRIRLDGSVHDNSGEGYAIYVNGKLLTEQKNGVTAWRRQGVRGSHVWTDFRDTFEGGKVTIAVANFPMSNWKPDAFIPAIGPLSVWMEEMKLPPVGE